MYLALQGNCGAGLIMKPAGVIANGIGVGIGLEDNLRESQTMIPSWVFSGYSRPH